LVYQNQNLRMFEFTMRNSIFGQALFGVTWNHVGVDIHFPFPMCSNHFPIICTQELVGKEWKFPEISGMITNRASKKCEEIDLYI
jgi:hypothetical protein